MTEKTLKISIEEARKIVLFSQRIPPIKQKGSALEATLSAIEHLGYIQIDTISVIQRAHHHTLWNRNPKYKNEHLDLLTAKNEIFEYWSHAAAYLPMKDFRFSLPRKKAIKTGEEKHWYKPDKKIVKSVLNRIKKEGPLMAKDFENKGEKLGAWQTNPAKQALKQLFMQGDLMLSSRTNFHKVYDITERVIPSTVDTSMPSSKEYIRFLIFRFLQANGIGQASEMAYLLKKTKSLISDELVEMKSNGEVLEVEIKTEKYFVLNSTLKLLEKRLNRTNLKILSPFDNLVIQRNRAKALFDFDYLLECYVPTAKRIFGYFVLPILWNGRFVARMDCKANRKTGVFEIKVLSLESWFKATDAFMLALQIEVKSFMEFNNCTTIEIHKTNPSVLKKELERLLET